MSLRVLVVDDSVVFVHLIKQALESIPGVQVVGTCRNGRAGLEKLRNTPVDLLTLDIEMPEMNGLQVLEAMRREGMKTAVIVLSAVGERARDLTVRALELGALDFIPKPECSGGEGQAVLRERLAPLVNATAHRKEIRSILRNGRAGESPSTPETLRLPKRGSPAPASDVIAPAVNDTTQRMNRLATQARAAMVLIGVSTGGPAALARIIPQLPASLRVPVLIVQHMPPLFTQNLADRLAASSSLEVQEARDGETARPGTVYIAPGGSHLKIAAGRQREIVMRITNDAPENNCRPSVDYLFRSAAVSFPGVAVAVILTGMGHDGTLGMRLLKASGCRSIAQDEASCTVFGMPKEAISAGVVDIVAPLDSIASEIIKAIG